MCEEQSACIGEIAGYRLYPPQVFGGEHHLHKSPAIGINAFLAGFGHPAVEAAWWPTAGIEQIEAGTVRICLVRSITVQINEVIVFVKAEQPRIVIGSLCSQIVPGYTY